MAKWWGGGLGEWGRAGLSIGGRLMPLDNSDANNLQTTTRRRPKDKVGVGVPLQLDKNRD